jgi:hypothetical protein
MYTVASVDIEVKLMWFIAFICITTFYNFVDIKKPEEHFKILKRKTVTIKIDEIVCPYTNMKLYHKHSI